jgi:hypothetical protein
MELSKRLWVAMIVLGACARLAPHPWNFWPLVAMSLFAGAKAQKTGTGFLATLLALILSDAVLGFYSGFWYVYAAALIPVLLGRLIRDRNGAGPIVAAAAASSLSFFLITNFMVWATGHMYPHTSAGLAACFTAAIPFFQNQLLGDAFYTTVFFGGYALVARRLRPAVQAAA